MNKNSKLKNAIDRIQQLEGSIKGFNGEKSEIYKELKGSGYDPKVVRKVLAILRKGAEAHDEEEATIQAYLAEVS
jgi:uncharacterized protein (UPF0335 family)